MIDHRDLDRVAADGLIEAGVAAVVNARSRSRAATRTAARSASCRRASRCSTTSAPSSWTSCSEGDVVRIERRRALARRRAARRGQVLDEAEIEAAMEDARAAIGTELERFAANTLEYIEKEARLTFEPLDAAAAAHRSSRAATRSSSCAATTTAPTSPRCARTSASTSRCSSGSTAAPTRCSSTGSSPTSSSATSTRCRRRALHCGAELVHHVHPDGRAPGSREPRSSGASSTTEFVAEGTSEDVAMLLAYESKAQLIVAVGTHATMVEFLDKGRPGHGVDVPHPAAARAVLVDAKGVSRLYEGRVRRRDIFLLVGAALIAMLVVGIVAEPIHVFAASGPRWA